MRVPQKSILVVGMKDSSSMKKVLDLQVLPSGSVIRLPPLNVLLVVRGRVSRKKGVLEE